MLKRTDKEKVVEQLTEDFRKAKSIVFTDFKGVKVNEAKVLRTKLRDSKVVYGVYKKTLIQIALNNAKIKGNIKDYKGPVGLAVSYEDEVTPAKVIYEYTRESGKLNIVSGVLEDKYLEKKEIVALAKLPSKEELIAKVVGSIKAPISNFVGVLSNVPRQLIYTLNSIKETKID
jgi:large subunit ribosomal protein L10